MLTGCRVGIAVQIPACRSFAARWQRVDIGQRPSDLFITPELGIARDQDEEAVGVRPDAASPQRGLDRLLVTPQMVKNPGLVGEPGRGPGIAGTEARGRSDAVLCTSLSKEPSDLGANAKTTTRGVGQLDHMTA